MSPQPESRPEASGWYEPDWPGSPISTLHPRAAGAQPIPVEEYLDGGRYVARFELPGVDPDADVHVTIGDRVLTVDAERRDSAPRRRHSEFRYGPLTRHVTLPDGSDGSDVTATYENGILQVTVGLTAQRPARQIAVVVPGRDAGTTDSPRS